MVSLDTGNPHKGTPPRNRICKISLVNDHKNGKSPSQTYKGCKKRQQPEREISHKLLALSRGYSKYYSVSVSGSGTRNSAGSMLILERTIALSSPGRTEIMKKEPEPGEKK